MSAVAEAIGQAYAHAHARECARVARWVEKTAWRLTDEHFEELLAPHVRLSEVDRVELREFRGRLIEERA